jgi:hypothetical protein
MHPTKGLDMRRLLIAALAVGLLSLPAAAQGGSGLKLRGTVTDKNTASGLVTVASTRLEHVLKIPGSLKTIRVGQRVKLRDTTLRQHGNGSHVLARGVLIVSARILDRDAVGDDDEREVRGRIASLSPLTVGGLTCAVPSAVSLVGFRVGDVAEMTCDLIRGVWTLRKIHVEDDDEVRDDDDDRRERVDDGRRDDRDDRSGDDDNSGHGGGATTTRARAAAEEVKPPAD